MSGEPLRFSRVIESIADGQAVDWSGLDESPDERERRILGHLRLIHSVAELHRTTIVENAETIAWPEGGQARDEAPRWGHLVLIEKLGEGAFGQVYRARDPWLDREVALKLHKHGPDHQTGVTRLIQEARTLARVQHPNVVAVHGADLHDGRVGLWMELVRGRTLADLVASTGPLSAEEATVIGQDLCRAVSAVHAAGLVHRDIKAQNVMRDLNGRLVLMDFGAGGTPLYLAPEVLEGGAATRASDVYALGVLVYFLLTGGYPVRGASIHDLRASHARGDRLPLRQARPDVPESLGQAVDRAIESSEEARFGSAEEFREALAAVPTRSVAPIREAPAPTTGWFRFTRRTTLAGALAAVVTATAGWFLWPVSTPLTSPDTSSIQVMAVLPFDNLSQAPDEAFIATGVTMELTSRLAEVGPLRVVPWSFMRRAATQTMTMQEIGDATKADAIVEGSVQLSPAGESADRRARVRVQLYKADTGALLWTEAYEHNFADVIALQANIAAAIATRVNAVLSRRASARLSRARPVVPGALEDFLKARELLEGRNDIPGALELFRSATQKDPGFAEAHAGLANCYSLESAYSASVSAQVALERTLAASGRAIALDPDMADAYAVRAFAWLALAFDWKAAEIDLTRALALDPDNAKVQDLYSNYLTIRGRHDEAVAASRKAEERSPMSSAYSRKVAWALYMGRRYDEAIAQLTRTLAIEPDYQPARTLLGRAYLLTGRDQEALEEFAATKWTLMAAVTRARAGDTAEALRLANSAAGATAPRATTPYDLAILYGALGNVDAGLTHLETAHRLRDAALAHLAVDPLLDPLRASPRYLELLRRMSLSD
ncbi:MAG: protein kinase domain-containing protein [Acidobacteriota bacterium]